MVACNAQSGGGEINTNYGFVANVAGTDLMVAQQAAVQTLGKVTAETSKFVKGLKVGGAVASVAGAVFSSYRFYTSLTNKLTYSDALNITAATFAVAGLFVSAPLVGGIGLGIGLFQMFSGAGGYLDLDNSTLYDNRNGLQSLKIK